MRIYRHLARTSVVTFAVVAAVAGGPACSSRDASETFASSGAALIDPSRSVLTHHNDPQRTGQYLAETTLTPASVPGLHEQYCYVVDGKVFAQPLYARGVPQRDGTTKNLVVIATTHNTLYAFDADDTSAVEPGEGTDLGCRLLVRKPYWQRTLAAPMPDANPYDAGIGSLTGIFGTPVIDPMTNFLYVVTRSGTPAPDGGIGCRTPLDVHDMASAKYCFFDLHQVDLASPQGAVINTARIAPTATGTDSNLGRPINFADMAGTQRQRAALLLANGWVYVAFAAVDYDAVCEEYHGWLVAYDTVELKEKAVLNTSPGWIGGGIWQSGSGPAIDETGKRLYVESADAPMPTHVMNCGRIATNGTTIAYPPDTTQPRGAEDSFLKLNAMTLAVESQYFVSSAAFVCRDSGGDFDLGSTGSMLVPNSNWLIGAGKDGWLRLLTRDNLTELARANIDNQPSRAPGCGEYTSSNHLHGAPVQWTTGSSTFVYAWPEAGHLRQFELLQNPPTLSPRHAQTFNVNRYSQGGILSISANGHTPGTGILWAGVCDDLINTDRCITQYLYAYDAETLQQLWKYRAPLQAYSRNKFTPPTIADGRVLLATFDPVAGQPDSARVHVFDTQPLVAIPVPPSDCTGWAACGNSIGVKCAWQKDPLELQTLSGVSVAGTTQLPSNLASYVFGPSEPAGVGQVTYRVCTPRGSLPSWCNPTPITVTLNPNPPCTTPPPAKLSLDPLVIDLVPGVDSGVNVQTGGNWAYGPNTTFSIGALPDGVIGHFGPTQSVNGSDPWSFLTLSANKSLHASTFMVTITVSSGASSYQGTLTVNIDTKCGTVTCAGQGAKCGTVADGCGGVLACGTCPSGLWCNAGTCATCVPVTCANQGAVCGTISNGCGGTLRCGRCAPGLSCVAHQCE